jgi:hypothetical protein
MHNNNKLSHKSDFRNKQNRLEEWLNSDDEEAKSTLQMLQQGQKAQEQRQYVANITNGELNFSASEDSNAIVLENIHFCNIRILGRITHLTIIKSSDCNIYVSHPFMSGCDISNCQRISIMLKIGDTSIQSQDHRRFEIMYSANISITTHIPIFLHLTRCMDVWVRQNEYTNFFILPSNAFLDYAFKSFFPFIQSFGVV